jgi:hypothetical protein
MGKTFNSHAETYEFTSKSTLFRKIISPKNAHVNIKGSHTPYRSDSPHPPDKHSSLTAREPTKREAKEE